MSQIIIFVNFTSLVSRYDNECMSKFMNIEYIFSYCNRLLDKIYIIYLKFQFQMLSYLFYKDYSTVCLHFLLQGGPFFDTFD